MRATLIFLSLFAAFSVQAQFGLPRYLLPWSVWVHPVNTNITAVTIETPRNANTNDFQIVSNGVVTFGIRNGGIQGTNVNIVAGANMTFTTNAVGQVSMASSGGLGGAQTPWGQDINAAFFKLGTVSSITASNIISTNSINVGTNNVNPTGITLNSEGATRVNGSLSVSNGFTLQGNANLLGNADLSGGSGTLTLAVGNENANRFGITNFGWHYSSNTLQASGSVYYQSNSALVGLLYTGQRDPLKPTSANAIANGALGGSNMVVFEAPGNINSLAIRTNGNITLGGSSAAATVYNLGLAADLTITTNINPVGGSASDGNAWHQNGDNSGSIWGNTNGASMKMAMTIGANPGATVIDFETINTPCVNIYGGMTNGCISSTTFQTLVWGGQHNTVNTAGTTAESIVGGQFNFIDSGGVSPFGSTILGGASNHVAGTCSYAFGQAASAVNDNSWRVNLIQNKGYTSDGTGGDNGSVGFALTSYFEITNSGVGKIRFYGSGMFETNTALARGATLQQSNSGNFATFYLGTNPPAAGHENTFNNGAIRSNKVFVVDVPTVADALTIYTNGDVGFNGASVVITNTLIASNIVANGSTGTNYMGANLNVNGTVNATALTNGASAGSLVQVTDANKKLIDATAAANLPINRDGTATTAAQLNTAIGGEVLTNGHTHAISLGSTTTFTSPASNYFGINVSAASAAPTNSRPSFDFTTLVALTNSATGHGAILIGGLSGTDTTGKMMQWCTLAVTNSAGLGSAFVTNITFAANTRIIGPTTLNLTNWTELLCEYWPPNGPTNVFVTPCW